MINKQPFKHWRILQPSVHRINFGQSIFMVIRGYSDKGMLPLTHLMTRNSVKVAGFLSADRLE